MAGRIPPPSQAPLITLPTLILAVETSDSNAARGRILQVSTVAMKGGAQLDQPRFSHRFEPGIPLSPEADDTSTTNSTDFAEVAKTLRELFVGRIVIGHAIATDLAALRTAAAQAGIPWRDPPALDIAHLTGILDPALPNPSMESLAERLGVTIDHDNPQQGKCLATGKVWGKLLALLREADIRTLGEAQFFAEHRVDSVSHDAEAGWYDGKVQAPPSNVPLPITHIDSYAFQRRLSDLMSAPPIMIGAATPLREVARTLCRERIGALLIGDPGAPPRGIVTERDLLQVTATGTQDLDTVTAAEIMNAPVESMAGNEMLYRALGRMDRLGIRHLCIVDSTGNAVGMISQRNLLQHRARSADMLGDEITKAENAEALATAYARVPEIASRLVDEGLDGLTIARFISSELRALTARAAEIAAGELAAEGRGTAPAPWCLLVLGSGGRGESLLGADQDNALIHTGSPGDDDWFARFGAKLADRLDAAGVPRCKGEVMVVTPRWRGTADEWSTRVESWLRKARPEDQLNVDIFFDLIPVAGEARLARELHANAVRHASTNLPFIGLLAESVNAVSPRLGMLGRLPTDQGRIDLKRDGLLPLVCLARTLALRIASTARSTPERLRDAVAAGRLPEGDAAPLIELHVELLTLVLQQQLIDLEAGKTPSSRVELKALSRQQRANLKHRLKHLDTVVRELRSVIAG